MENKNINLSNKKQKSIIIKNLNFYYTFIINKSSKNIFFSLIDYKGNLIFKFSSGLLNIKNKIYRYDSYNISKICKYIYMYFKKTCYGHLKIKFKNCQTPLINSVIEPLGGYKYYVFIIDLLVFKPHNGMRLKKARRL